MSELLDAIETLGNNGLDVIELCNELLNNGKLENGEFDRKLLALCIHLDGSIDIDCCSYDSDCRFESGSAKYLVLDENERNDRWAAALESYLDEGCVEGSGSPYFDRESWKDDARMNGAGSWLSSYSGNEYEVDDYYIYRIC